MTGRFIVLEGLDGAGTTTQLLRLARRLESEGLAVETTREPTTGPLGAVLRQAVEGRLALDATTLALAFAADRADHLFNPHDGIVKGLAEGRWVLCDRYVLSSLAYQAGEGVERAWLERVNAFAPAPDLTIFVDTPVEVCLSRIAARSAREERFHHREALEATLAGYRAGLAGVRDPLIVDGDREAEAVDASIWDGVRARLRTA